jgi:hypothetical protein
MNEKKPALHLNMCSTVFKSSVAAIKKYYISITDHVKLLNTFCE